MTSFLSAFLLGIASGFVGSVPVAGPISILVFGMGSRGHGSQGRALASGAALSEAGYAVLSLIGIEALFTSHPKVATVTRLVGALVVFAVGVVFLRTNPVGAEARQAAETADAERRTGHHGTFWLGFTITALNPSVLATWTAATSILVSLGWLGDGPGKALFFGLGVAIGIVAWFTLLVAGLERLGARLEQRVVLRFQQGMGALLLGLGVWLALKAF